MPKNGEDEKEQMRKENKKGKRKWNRLRHEKEASGEEKNAHTISQAVLSSE